MKICYLDESGTGDDPIVVVAGVVVDTYRMHVTKLDWNLLLSDLSSITGKPLSELHTKDFYKGNPPFRNFTGAQRSEYISSIFRWFCERKHAFVYSSIIKGRFRAAQTAKSVPPELETPWRSAAFHVVLSLQRAHQSLEKTKGHTLLIFDNKHEEQAHLTRLVLNPPDWSDEYYGRNEKEPKLSHIVDAPYFADSTSVALIQVADFLAYFLRRYAEIAEGLIPAKYPEEQAKVEDWIKMLAERSIGAAHIYPIKNRCSTAHIFYDYCPPSLRRL